jgi:hypothetical protein
MTRHGNDNSNAIHSFLSLVIGNSFFFIPWVLISIWQSDKERLEYIHIHSKKTQKRETGLDRAHNKEIYPFPETKKQTN